MWTLYLSSIFRSVKSAVVCMKMSLHAFQLLEKLNTRRVQYYYCLWSRHSSMYIFFFIPNTRFWKDKHGNCWRTIQRQRCVFLYFGNNTTGSRISCKPDSVLHACTNSLLNCNPFFSAAFLKSFLIRMPCYSILILCYLIKCDPSFVHYLQKM